MALLLVLGMETGLSLAAGARAAGSSWVENLRPVPRPLRADLSRRRWVARNLPRPLGLIGQDHRGFYIPRGYTMELAHRCRTGLGQNHESSREIVEILTREGYTHLMMCPPLEKDSIEFDSTLGKLLSPWLAGQETALSRESGRSGRSCPQLFHLRFIGRDRGARVKESPPR